MNLKERLNHIRCFVFDIDGVLTDGSLHVLQDGVMLRKMNINTASVDELGRHPYIGFLLAKMLASYRLQHGFFRRVEEIRQLPLVDADLYSKLAPYLTISP